MARLRPPIKDTLAAELYDHFIDFIDTEGAVPIQRAFWRWLIGQNKYTSEQLSEHTFNYHFDRLIEDGWIRIEPKTRALSPLDPDTHQPRVRIDD